MQSRTDITAAEIFLHTRLIFGERGNVARVSRCLPGSPRATLYETLEKAEAVAALGKKCCPDCIGAHSTEEIPPLVDEVPYEIGYRR